MSFSLKLIIAHLISLFGILLFVGRWASIPIFLLFLLQSLGFAWLGFLLLFVFRSLHFLVYFDLIAPVFHSLVAFDLMFLLHFLVPFKSDAKALFQTLARFGFEFLRFLLQLSDVY